jgi:hypothetical protein
VLRVARFDAIAYQTLPRMLPRHVIFETPAGIDRRVMLTCTDLTLSADCAMPPPRVTDAPSRGFRRGATRHHAPGRHHAIRRGRDTTPRAHD